MLFLCRLIPQCLLFALHHSRSNSWSNTAAFEVWPCIVCTGV